MAASVVLVVTPPAFAGAALTALAPSLASSHSPNRSAPGTPPGSGGHRAIRGATKPRDSHGGAVAGTITTCEFTAADESRAKDLTTFRVAAKRRYIATVLLAAVLLIGVQFDIAQVTPQTIATLVLGALALNFGLTSIASTVLSRTASVGNLHAQRVRPWLRYAFVALDAALISTVVFVFGAPVLVLTYLLAIVPYSFDHGRATGYVAAGLSALGFVSASLLYAAQHPQTAAPLPQTILAAALLLVVSQQIVPLPSRLIRRVRDARAHMNAAEHGDLLARADARHDDELGYLERSFNNMLGELGALIATVQSEADELAAVSEQLSGASTTLNARAADVVSTSRSLSEELAAQRRGVENGALASRQARDAAETARHRADATAMDAHTLDEAAETSRLAIERAASTLVQVGEGVSAAAGQVRLLEPASERVGEFVSTVSRIARQTNLLALNAAIEASRAGEHGYGFAVVAEEIRKLAGESAQAAKAVAATVQHVRDDIADAVEAMEGTAREVAGAGGIAREATQALGAMVDGIGRIAQRSQQAAVLARTQASLAASVAGAFETVDEAAERASHGAERGTEYAAGQRVSIQELSRSAQQLAATADRLRGAVLRYRVAQG
ncbi:MAG: methyl-accepting chemotaxis protein [Gemmatimonas sp.]